MTISSVQFGSTAAMQAMARTSQAPMAQQQQPATGLQADTVMFGASSKPRRAGIAALLLAAVGLGSAACGSESEPINLTIKGQNGSDRSASATVGTDSAGNPSVYISGESLTANGDQDRAPIFYMAKEEGEIELVIDGDNVADIESAGNNKYNIVAEYENEELYNGPELKQTLAQATVEANGQVVVRSTNSAFTGVKDGTVLVTASIPPETKAADVVAATYPGVIEALTGQRAQLLEDHQQEAAENNIVMKGLTAETFPDYTKYATGEMGEAYMNGSVIED